jgi:hypothetical protein
MPPVTKLQLENAALDAQTLESVANGAYNLGGNGLVTSRQGQQIKTVAKVIDDIGNYEPTGVWVTATAYTIKQLAKESGIVYVCTEPHTAGVFATDLAAGKWAVFQALDSSVHTYTQGGAGSVERTVESRLQDVVSVLDFGAIGDGVADDSDAFQLAIATNTTIMIPEGTYRFLKAVNIPNSCFTRFIGAGNLPIPRSKIFVDYSGPAFHHAPGNTSFYCFENLQAFSLEAHTLSQFIKDEGTNVHTVIKRMSIKNFNSIAMQFNSAFRCDIEFLGEYCWNYMMVVSGGSANRVKFTIDHSYAGGVDLSGGGFLIEPYTEMMCSRNDPSAENESWYEIILKGAGHTIVGGTINMNPVNDKYPILCVDMRGVTFTGLYGFNLGTGAPYFVHLSTNLSSASLINCLGLTYGGVTDNVVFVDSGYSTEKPEIALGTQSISQTTQKAWGVMSGADGSLTAGTPGVTSSRVSVGRYRLTWPAGSFANTNYLIAASFDTPTDSTMRYASKTSTSVDVFLSAPGVGPTDAYEVCISVTGV